MFVRLTSREITMDLEQIIDVRTSDPSNLTTTELLLLAILEQMKLSNMKRPVGRPKKS